MVLANAASDAERRLAEAVNLAGQGRVDWISCLESLHDAFAADSTIMYAPPHAERSFVPFLLHKVDLSRIASKLQSYSTKTPFLDEAIKRGLAPGAFFDRDVAPEEVEDSEHHRDILEAIDWTDGLQFVLRLPSAPEGGLVLKLWRFHPTPRYGEDERRLARLILPHLLEATKGKFTSPPTPQTNSIAPEALDGLSTPFIVFCSAGKPVYLNAAAQTLVAKGDVIRFRNGKIETLDKKASRSFRQAIEQAANGDAHGLEIVLPRADERAPVLGIVNSIAKERRGFSDEAAAIVYFVDVEAHDGHAVHARRAQILFALTDAECEVLRLLLDDLSIEEIAGQRHSAVATVRTQVKAILQKTRGHRQSDLLRLRRLAI